MINKKELPVIKQLHCSFCKVLVQLCLISPTPSFQSSAISYRKTPDFNQHHQKNNPPNS